MKQFVAALLVVALLIGFSFWRFVSRLDDCRSLNHGTLYCLVVWGGR